MCILTLRTYTHILTQKSIVRTLTTAIEVFLTLIRLIVTFRTQKSFGDGAHSLTSHMKAC